MFRAKQKFAAVWCALALLAAAGGLAAQQVSREIAIQAREQLFVEITAGAAQMKSRTLGSGDSASTRYYVLIPRLRTGPAVLVFDSSEARIAQIPPAPQQSAAKNVAELDRVDPKQPLRQYAHDFDVDSAGNVYLADRTGNAVHVYGADGKWLRSMATPAPNSVAALPEGEVAVASARGENLITVLNAAGKIARSFGDPLEVTEDGTRDLNRFLNLGRVASDPAGNLYYAFSYVPEPTVRKYDRFGYLAYTAALTTLDFLPAAQAARRHIGNLGRINLNEVTPAQIKPNITAIAADPETQQFWVAIGGLLLQFNRDGDRIATYRTYTQEGLRIEASAIIVEPERLILASDSLGIFSFARPDKAKK